MNTTELREMLEDEKSRAIFDARINFKKDKRLSEFYNRLKSTGEKYTFREIDAFIHTLNKDNFYIWGCDDYAVYSYQVLVDSGYNVIGLLSDTKVKVDGIDCFYWKEITEQLEDCAVIVFQRNVDDVPEYILSKCNPLLLYSHVVGRCGHQYFDYFLSQGEEYFVDAGALDGATTRDFIEWCDGNYGAVYAFEVNPLMVEECDNNLRSTVEDKKLFYIECALWDKQGEVSFDNSISKWSAHISVDGKDMVKTDTIDNLIGNKPVTFIKFDIEGSELKALYGAKNCIINNRPRMAISVYHNDDDMENIMEFLCKLDCGYRFALRHYHSDAIETILYVF